MSLFGSHDRNKSPTVGSRDNFPLRQHSWNWADVALHSCNSECCWFFTASQLSVVMLLYGVASFRIRHSYLGSDRHAIDAAGVFCWSRFLLQALRHAAEVVMGFACSVQSSSCIGFFFIRRSDPYRFFIHSFFLYGSLDFIGSKPFGAQPKLSS